MRKLDSPLYPLNDVRTFLTYDPVKVKKVSLNAESIYLRNPPAGAEIH
jgi:hypothetical protein